MGAGNPALLLSALLLLLNMSACEDRRADKAYLRGNYDKAVTDIEFLANGGEARAQYDLGLMYDQGNGVPQNDAQAMYWYSLAAEQGEPRAQYNLGFMYLNGQGVQADLVKAYQWVTLSANRGNVHAADARDFIGENMSPEQIAEGKRLVQQYEDLKHKNTCTFCKPYNRSY